MTPKREQEMRDHIARGRETGRYPAAYAEELLAAVGRLTARLAEVTAPPPGQEGGSDE